MNLDGGTNVQSIAFYCTESLVGRECLRCLPMLWTTGLDVNRFVHLSLSPALSALSPHYKKQRDKEL